jgi:hypothetical protein
MWHFTLWPILAIWMGLAFVVLATVVGIIVWSTSHLARDVAAGEDAVVWCPVHKQMMHVKGIPRGTRQQPYADVRRCEYWGEGSVECAKVCLETRLPTEQHAA